MTRRRRPAAGRCWDYAAWLERRFEERRPVGAGAPAGLFSILTCVYAGSPVPLFRRTAASVLAQLASAFEWVVVAQGELPGDLSAALVDATGDRRVRCLLKPDNDGIIRGLRTALETATGDYVLPLDGDDVLMPDALAVLAGEIERRGRPSFVYGDEDALVEGEPTAPYFRPDWDPLLNLASSYIWHPSAFDRRRALELDVFGDDRSEYCQDWDTVSRFAAAGERPVHVTEVLYHWTAHGASSTNRETPHQGSIASQRHVLERELARRGLAQAFELTPFPLERGLLELWPRRRRIDPPEVSVVCVAQDERAATSVLGRVARSCGYPARAFVAVGSAALSPRRRRSIADAAAVRPGAAAPQVGHVPLGGLPGLRRAVDEHPGTWIAVVTPQALPVDADWLWEAVALAELEPSVGFVSGRLVDARGIVHGGGELWGVGDPLGCPDRGHRASEAGPYAMSLKPHCVSGLDARFFLARTGTLREALADLPDEASLAGLGVWLGLWAERHGVLIAYSPLVRARCHRDTAPLPLPTEERRAVELRFGALPPAHPLIRLYALTAGRGPFVPLGPASAQAPARARAQVPPGGI